MLRFDNNKINNTNFEHSLPLTLSPFLFHELSVLSKFKCQVHTLLTDRVRFMYDISTFANTKHKKQIINK